MKIETQRLILRDYRPEDLEIYYTLKAEPTVWEDLGGAAVHQKGEAAKLLGDPIASQISSDTGYRALCLKDGTFIGEAGILQVNKNDNRCRLGYRLLPAYWGNGYATEIVTALAQLAFRVLKMERVEALTLAENRAACAVLEKAGFTKEGELRHYRRLVSDYQNVCFYGKLRTDA